MCQLQSSFFVNIVLNQMRCISWPGIPACFLPKSILLWTEPSCLSHKAAGYSVLATSCQSWMNMVKSALGYVFTPTAEGESRKDLKERMQVIAMETLVTFFFALVTPHHSTPLPLSIGQTPSIDTLSVQKTVFASGTQTVGIRLTPVTSLSTHSFSYHLEPFLSSSQIRICYHFIDHSSSCSHLDHVIFICCSVSRNDAGTTSTHLTTATSQVFATSFHCLPNMQLHQGISPQATQPAATSQAAPVFRGFSSYVFISTSKFFYKEYIWWVSHAFRLKWEKRNGRSDLDHCSLFLLQCKCNANIRLLQFQAHDVENVAFVLPQSLCSAINDVRFGSCRLQLS